MHKVSNKTLPEKIKGRALEIYLDLCRDADKMPTGSVLPSLRELQRRYSASQKTVKTALDHLATTRQLLRQPRRKTRIFSTASTQKTSHWIPQHTLVTTLGLSGSIAATWQPIIDRFNENNHRIIKPHYVETLPELIELSCQGKVDFVLFHCNPILDGCLGSTLPFIDLKEFIKTMKLGDFYSAMLIVDPGNRFWGIAADLAISVILSNRRFGKLPCEDFTWGELLPYLRKIKKDNPTLLYPLGLNGYSIFLMQNGVNMVDSVTGELNFSPDKFTDSLYLLKSIINENIAPLFSETYYDHASMRWFENNQVAACEIFPSVIKHFGEFCPEFDLLPMPAAPGAVRSVFSEFFSICASSINYSTAWDFIMFALSRPIQKLLIENNTVMPVRRHLAPPHMTPEQFDVFSNVLDNSSMRPEDYYLPVPLRLMIETGVDRWIKFNGDIKEFLFDLEKSCRLRLKNLKPYSL